MKALTTIALLTFVSVSYGKNTTGKVCINIPERGLEIVKIENTCQKGDIIKLDKKNVSFYCDFNSAIVNYNDYDKYGCVYLGYKRDLREGSAE